MKLYLFRHGEKSSFYGADPGLSRHGHIQAKALSEAILQKKLETPTELLVSPKLRAHETFIPTAEVTQVPLGILAEVDERSASETATKMLQRVHNFLDELPLQRRESSVVYICSHMDWLEQALDYLGDSSFTFQSCEWILFEYQQDHWKPINRGVFP